MGLGYKTPIVEISKSDSKQLRYEVEKEKRGWFQYDDLAELWNKDAQKSRITYSPLPAGNIISGGSNAVANFITIDRQHLSGAIMRPVVNAGARAEWQDAMEFGIRDVNGDYITDDTGYMYGDHLKTGQWFTTSSEDGMHYEYAQGRMLDGNNVPVQARIKFRGHIEDSGYIGFCPNGFFEAGVTRQSITEETLDYLFSNGYSNAIWTQIYFGDYRWCLALPLVGTPQLYKDRSGGAPPPGWEGGWPTDWVPCEWTEGDLSAISAEKMGTDGLTYKIGVIGNAICVTESTFDDDFAYYCEDGFDQPIVPHGPIEIRTWPGQGVYRLTPLHFVESTSAGPTNYIYRHPFGITTTAARESWIDQRVWGRPIEDFGNTYLAMPGVDFTGAAGDYEGYYRYWIEAYPGRYPSVVVPGEMPQTMTTPFIEGVSVWQSPEVTDHGEQTFGQIDRARFELGVRSQEFARSTSARHDLTVDNRLSTDDPPEGEEGRVPTEDFTLGRMLKTDAGWVFTDGSQGTQQMGDLFIVGAQRDSRYAAFGVTDMLGRLALTEWDSGNLNLREWKPKNAIELLLQMHGIGPEWYDLEDLDLQLTGEDAWAFEQGTSVADIIAKIADEGGGGAAIWYDGSTQKIRTGCKYCGAKRTDADWQSHQDNGWNSSGCRAADLERNPDGYDVAIVDNPEEADDPGSLYIAERLEGRVDAIDRNEYANRITVIGKTQQGREISATWEDDAALYDTTSDRYTGIPISKVVRENSLKTRDALNKRLVELAHQYSAWPLRVRITIPFYSNLRPGYVAKVEGAKYADAHGKLFRIQRMRHDLGNGETELIARHLADVDTSI